MKHNLYLIISILLVGIVTYLIFEERKKTNLTFPDFGASLPINHQILGLDVSHHQGEINWDQALKMSIRGDSLAFVFLKLTEGLDFEDERAQKNIEALKTAGMPFGVYHFFNPNKSALLQAKFFVARSQKTTLKPVLDIELRGPLSVKDLIDSTTVFLSEVEKSLKVRPIIYTYESFYKDFFSESTLEGEWFWIANYTGQSKAFNRQNVIAWQFSEKGTVDGISEKVDLNTAKPHFWKVAKW